MTRYNAPKRTIQATRGTLTMEPIPDPELTAIYARKSMKGDKKEITVNRQKRLALDDCEKLGLTVHRENVFVDNGASAWKRKPEKARVGRADRESAPWR